MRLEGGGKNANSGEGEMGGSVTKLRMLVRGERKSRLGWHAEDSPMGEMFAIFLRD